MTFFESFLRYMRIYSVLKIGSIKVVCAAFSEKYVDSSVSEREIYRIFCVHSEEAVVELLRENICCMPEENVVIFTTIKITVDETLKNTLENRGIEVFDERAVEEIRLMRKAYRKGINLPNFGRGRFKFSLTAAVKQEEVFGSER